jgi:hypothetical protein
MPPLASLPDTPPNLKELNELFLLQQLPFNPHDQLFPLAIHLVLGIEKGTVLVALRFKGAGVSDFSHW